MEEDYEWPADNEDRQESLIRKHRNAAKLNSVRQSRYHRTADIELIQQLRENNAEYCRQYRNPQDPDVTLQRHQDNA